MIGRVDSVILRNAALLLSSRCSGGALAVRAAASAASAPAVNPMAEPSHVGWLGRRASMVAVMLAVRVIDGALCQQQHKASARQNRLSSLIAKPVNALSAAESKEMAGLRRLDTYDEASFSPEHTTFKESHNAIFIDLAVNGGCLKRASPLFYLDGPGGSTTSALLAAGFQREQLFTANWIQSTARALCSAPHHLHSANVAALPAAEALRTTFAGVPFAAVYLDGCGGMTEPITDALAAVFDGQLSRPRPPQIVIGFTLTQAEPTGRSLFDREMDIHRALMAHCRRAGYRLVHALDEPDRYGIDALTVKHHGTTMTSWLLLTTRDTGAC